MSKFKTKAEAQQAIQDMERRAERNDTWVNYGLPVDPSAADLLADSRDYRAEAARIRALLPTLPEAGA